MPDTVACANCPLPVFYDQDDQVWRHIEHEGITCGSDAYRDPEDHATPAPGSTLTPAKHLSTGRNEDRHA